MTPRPDTYFVPPRGSYGHGQGHVRLYSVYVKSLYHERLRFHAIGQQRRPDGSLALLTVCGLDTKSMVGVAVVHARKIAEPCRKCFSDGAQPDLIGPERSEGPSLARSRHAHDTPARCDLFASEPLPRAAVSPASGSATGAGSGI